MTQYQVDSDAVLSAESAVRASASRIQGEVAGMLGQLLSLQSSWTGQASTAFQGVVADWRTTQQHVEQSLAGITQALGRAGQQYAEAERANASMFMR
ncbi:WXG100 family type VII secretion target [Salinibacterium sp. dk2585]|uniref:WXG100 family type VII secretion target n=1 Tax=unclassified Salinibacterium TaxID=2632331 RepID=UPI0011C24EF5|nr:MULTISPECIES: WXG100 family type VII secretion target [unclassified Salinibacterium]QEE62189.1 WXG100 family type VII secretion target [Salinibacterium sp. dk2585]TXK53541.1 WXG100 family type VII secretion target [Salinibacterium sp. dk5596]